MTNDHIILHHKSLDEGRLLAQKANDVAASYVFQSARLDKSTATIKAYRSALKRFNDFLETKGLDVGNLYDCPENWKPITWGLVQAYKVEQLDKGTVISTLNQHLSIIRSHAKLASQAGYIDTDEYLRISFVKSVKSTKAKHNVNAKRKVKRLATKTVNTLSKKDVKKLGRRLRLVDTPSGKRDVLLFELLFRHGLRSSEVVSLTRESFNGGVLEFYRSKTGTFGVHELESDGKKALVEYLKVCGKTDAFLQSGCKSGRLTGASLSTGTLRNIVRRWGVYVGVEYLSPHDARHTIATMIANKKGVTAKMLLDFFGWASLSTAQRYIEAARIGNKQLKRVF